MTTETVTTGANDRRRRAVPILRQPREVPPVRHHDEREGGGRGAHRRRARPPQADAPGAARVRRRDRQRDRARQRAPRSAPTDADRAVRGGRQGSQHGGHPADPVDPARSLLRAPRDRGRAHQHVLRRGARSCIPRNDDRAGPRSTGGTSVSTARRRTSSSNRSVNSRTCSPRGGRRSRARRPATRCTTSRRCSCCTARTVPSRSTA